MISFLAGAAVALLSSETTKENKTVIDTADFNPEALGLPYISYNQEKQLGLSEVEGLGKPVSPNDVYQMITNKMLAMIKEASGKGYKKKWKANVYGKGYLIPFNFVTKKRYRGVNHFLLTSFEPLENPFFLTFKQVEKLGGKVKKGSFGNEVVYFTKLFKVVDVKKDVDFGTYDIKKALKVADKNGIPHENITYIPILKYYNVFNGKDIEGIDFDLENFKTGFINQPLPPTNKMPIPEAILKNYPKPQPTLRYGGDRAYYQPGADHIQMPYMADFETSQDYYRTLFHEYAHSTGVAKRLNRDMNGKFGSKKYAFEELIAEWGATFLSAEAGIIFHTNNNHAEYLKNWNNALTHMKNDNKFIMRACSKAQELTDYILVRDKNGDPKYYQDLKAKSNKKSDPLKAKVVKHLEAMSLEEFANDYAYLFSADLDKVLYRIEDKKTHKEYIDKLTEKAIKDNRLDVIGFEEKKTKAKSKKSEQLALFGSDKKGLGLPTAKNKDTIAFNKELLSAKRNGFNVSQVFKLGKTKDILKKHIGEHSITISESVIKKAISGKKDHIATFDNFINLPDQINNPVAIFKSKTSKDGVVIITQLVTYQEKPLMVAIHLNQHFKIAKIASIYNRQYKKDYAKWMSEGLLLYINKKSFNALLPGIIPISQTIKGQSKYTKTKPNHKKSNFDIEAYLNRVLENFNNEIKELSTAEKEELKKRYKNREYKSQSFECFVEDYVAEKIALKFNKQKKGLGNPVIVDVASELDNTPLIVENNQPEQKEQPAANVFKEVTKAAAPSTPKSPDTQDQKQSAKSKKDVMSSADIMNMDFDSLDFTGKWLDFMQDPAKNMRIAIWGKPKNGKTAGATTLANYLTNFGSVLYNFSDQGFNKSTKDLWQLSGLSNKPNAYAVATRDLEELDKLCASGDYDFVFIDMINTYIHRTGIKYFEFEDRFLKKYPNISFILIFEVTKNGDFKGDQGWTHLVDAIVTVDSFVMENQGRYGVGHYVVWEEGLKKTNPKKYNEFIDETENLEPLPSEMQIDL